MNQKASDQLVKARIALIMENPFFGTLALRLVLQEDTTCATLWVDGVHIGYNPEFILTLSHSLTKSALAHEVGHCIFDHIDRRGARNPMKWNRAGDYIINGMLKDAGFELGDGWLYDAAFTPMSADHVYNLLPDSPENGGNGPGIGKPGGGLCDIRSGPTTNDSSKIDEWKMATAMAANAARLAGKLPGGLERFVKDLLNPKADWRSTLRRFVTEENKADYSWMRPNKRFVHMDYFLPSLHSHGMGEIIVAVDTSGSITQNMLDIFRAEVQSIRDTVRPRITRIIYCDSRINHVAEFTAEDELEMALHGGGGTDFRPPFELVEENGWRPAAFLYLTDLYGQAPDSAPDYPVLWCCTTAQEAPWGDRVEIDVD